MGEQLLKGKNQRFLKKISSLSTGPFGATPFEKNSKNPFILAFEANCATSQNCTFSHILEHCLVAEATTAARIFQRDHHLLLSFLLLKL